MKVIYIERYANCFVCAVARTQTVEGAVVFLVSYLMTTGERLSYFFQELFASGGVDMLIEYLKKDPAKVHSPLGDHALFLASVDCIWYDDHLHAYTQFSRILCSPLHYLFNLNTVFNN